MTFHVSSSFVSQFLSVARLIETPTTNSAYLWRRSQKDVHLFCNFKMTSTWARKCKEGFLSYPTILWLSSEISEEEIRLLRVHARFAADQDKMLAGSC